MKDVPRRVVILEKSNSELADLTLALQKERDRFKEALMNIRSGAWRYYEYTDSDGKHVPSYFELLDELLVASNQEKE